MESEPSIEITFVGDAALLDALEAEAMSHTDAIQIKGRASVSDPSRLGFDVTTIAVVAAVVAIVRNTFFDESIARTLHRAFDRARSKAKVKTIHIVSPLGEVTFDYTEDLTEDQVRAKLEALSRL